MPEKVESSINPEWLQKMESFRNALVKGAEFEKELKELGVGIEIKFTWGDFWERISKDVITWK